MFLETRNPLSAEVRGPEEAPGRVRTFLCTDMEASTRMVERLGDVEAHRVAGRHDDLLRSWAAAFAGREILRHGDGFLFAFADARHAVLCAVAMQQMLALPPHAEGEHVIRVRIGLHTGSAIRSGNGFFGKAVIVATRIAMLAKGGEILASRSTIESASDLAGILSGEPRTVELKGLSDAYTIHPVLAAVVGASAC